MLYSQQNNFRTAEQLYNRAIVAIVAIVVDVAVVVFFSCLTRHVRFNQGAAALIEGSSKFILDHFQMLVSSCVSECSERVLRDSTKESRLKEPRKGIRLQVRL